MDAIRSDNSAASQRARLFRHLKEVGPITTLGARSMLDICHPGMRICELRKAGHLIGTAWTNDLTPEGYSHRVGKYILLPRKQLTLNDFLPERGESQTRGIKTATPGSGGNHPRGIERLKDVYKDNMSPLCSQASILQEGEVI